jgi:transcriptional regulator with XRE-family HTH domain
MQPPEFPQAFLARKSPLAVTMRAMAGRPSKTIIHPPNRIQQIRKAKGLTLEWLAEQIGKSDETVRKYETGDEGVSPTLYVLERIAKALGVKAHVLVNDYDARAEAEAAALLAIFRRLGADERERALSVLAALESYDNRARGAGG